MRPRATLVATLTTAVAALAALLVPAGTAVARSRGDVQVLALAPAPGLPARPHVVGNDIFEGTNPSTGKLYEVPIERVELDPAGHELARSGQQYTGADNSAVPFDTPSGPAFYGTRLTVANQSSIAENTADMALLDLDTGEQGMPVYVPRDAGLKPGVQPATKSHARERHRRRHRRKLRRGNSGRGRGRG